ncbi:hypothetical protein [Microbacterium sp. TNHR37B]|uniref:hypothetical protein n=1 Tax=Microbacterium sp. TNHR37B TaxID=1775956 RepID=UPI0007B297C2|nr:hypothetical protein [Microbacterium sp. TNHR37B]KZE89669.1 hypothetical protein AVP41_02467 [Microbacterium sp. TNHR37B]
MERELTRRVALKVGAGTVLAGLAGVSLTPGAYAAPAPQGTAPSAPAQASTGLTTAPAAVAANELMEPPPMATRTFGTLRATDWTTPPIRFEYKGKQFRRYPDASKKNHPAEAWVHVYLATWKKSKTEVLVHGGLSKAAAKAKAHAHTLALGRVPNFLRREVKEMRIYSGAHSATSLNRVISIYEGANYPTHRWANVYLHEAAHCLNEKLRANKRLLKKWNRAVAADRVGPKAQRGGFISEYARDHRKGEDFGESVISWLALRFHPDRLAEQAPGAAPFIRAQIPNRMAFFRARGWDTAPWR